MSEHNYFGMASKAERDANPNAYIVTDETVASVEAHIKKFRAAQDKANPPKPVQGDPVKSELNSLRSQLFNLKQNAKYAETIVNNEAGNVREFERRITEFIKTKKQHEDAGNVLGARSVEHGIQTLENELADARDRLVKEQRYNATVARQLRMWQAENGQRLTELQKAVG
jgi:hypothetical protein